MESDMISLPPESLLTSSKIKFLLQSEKIKYQIIKNESSILSADWWQGFGYPAKLGENDKYHRIVGFVSCFKCFNTFIYNNSSGTTRLKQHANKCFSTTLSSSSSIAVDEVCTSTYTQATLAQHGFKKNSRLCEKEIENIKQLSAQWVCHDLRPFCTLEDLGFRALAQELIRIGHKHGVVDVNEVLRGRHTISRTVYDLADSYRQLMKEILVEPLKARAVTICPDFWSDPYRNISYLGLNVSFVNADYKSFSIDLFCRPFSGVKSSELLLKALEKHLSEFGIDDLSSVNIVSDRGSNFVSAFRNLNTLFCFGHRLNNIVKICFFQNVKKKKQTSNSSTSAFKSPLNVTTSKEGKTVLLNINDCLSSEETTEDEEEVNMKPTIPVLRRKRKNKLKSTNNQQESERKMSLDDIPLAARSILNTLTKCKKIVKYIKKSGLNKEIEDNGGGTVHQSIAIRWLSIIESLESILKSFKIIKKILVSKQQQKLTTNIEEKTIKQIILILKPLKHVVKMVQTGNSPSLFMVLLCVETLYNVMSSYNELLNYDNDHSNSGSEELDEDLSDELEGINFFWNRIRRLLEEMFTLDIRHYVAALLHPKYRSLKMCSERERSECYAYVRQQLELIYMESNQPNQQQTSQPSAKKFKRDLFSRFESATFDIKEEASAEESENETEECSSRCKKTDELARYLNLELDKSKLESNPLSFWREQKDKFPRLARYARCIHSIPATSASVERQFSGAGLIIQERRTNLNPEQLDNILLIRSMQKNKILG